MLLIDNYKPSRRPQPYFAGSSDFVTASGGLVSTLHNKGGWGGEFTQVNSSNQLHYIDDYLVSSDGRRWMGISSPARIVSALTYVLTVELPSDYSASGASGVGVFSDRETSPNFPTNPAGTILRIYPLSGGYVWNAFWGDGTTFTSRSSRVYTLEEFRSLFCGRPGLIRGVFDKGRFFVSAFDEELLSGQAAVDVLSLGATTRADLFTYLGDSGLAMPQGTKLYDALIADYALYM